MCVGEMRTARSSHSSMTVPSAAEVIRYRTKSSRPQTEITGVRKRHVARESIVQNSHNRFDWQSRPLNANNGSCLRVCSYLSPCSTALGSRNTHCAHAGMTSAMGSALMMPSKTLQLADAVIILWNAVDASGNTHRRPAVSEQHSLDLPLLVQVPRLQGIEHTTYQRISRQPSVLIRRDYKRHQAESSRVPPYHKPGVASSSSTAG